MSLAPSLHAGFKNHSEKYYRDRMYDFLSMVFSGERTSPYAFTTWRAYLCLVVLQAHPLGKMLVLQGGGANGKSALTSLYQSLFGISAAKAIDALVFQSPEEFRKSSHILVGGSLMVCEECHENKELQSPVIKNLITGGKLLSRPLHSDQDKMLTFPRSGFVWNLSEKVPYVSGLDTPGAGDWHAWHRRFLDVRLDAVFTSKRDDIDPPNYVYAADATLVDELSRPEMGTVFLKHVILPFLREYTYDELVAMLENPGEIIENATEDFIRNLARTTPSRSARFQRGPFSR